VLLVCYSSILIVKAGDQGAYLAFVLDNTLNRQFIQPLPMSQPRSPRLLDQVRQLLCDRILTKPNLPITKRDRILTKPNPPITKRDRTLTKLDPPVTQNYRRVT